MKKNICIAFCIQVLFCCLLFSPLVSQVETQNRREREQFEPSHFSFGTYSYASDTASLSRVFFYVQIEYAALKFIKSDEKGFTSSYEGQLSFFDSTNSLVYEKHWNGEVNTKVYEQTISNHAFSTYVQQFTLTPHHYHVTILIRDLETRKMYREEREVNVPLYISAQLNISDIMFIDQSRKIEGKDNLFPSVNRIFMNTSTETKIYFEAYNAKQPEDVTFMYRMLNAKKEEVTCDSVTQQLQQGTNKIYLGIKSFNFTMGEYTLELSAIAKDTVAEPIIRRSSPFSIRWEGISFNVADINEAITQLVYMAKTEELDSLQDKSLTEEERRDRFMKFWKRRDPTPITPRNELMEEYYHRVSEANKEFGTHSPGWRTDRGMVYIIFGTPDNVERHPFDLDSKPYEIWSYYEQNKKFTFVDETGFGDFRLTTPLYEVWGGAKR